MCKLAYEVKSHRKVRPFAKDWINLGGDLLKAFEIILKSPVVICEIPATLYSRIATKSGMGAISPCVPPAQAEVLLWEVPLWKHFKSFKWQLCLPVALTVEIKCSTELIRQTNLTWKPCYVTFCLFCGSAAVKILQRVFFLKSLYDPQRESTTWLFFFIPLVRGWSQQAVWVLPKVVCSGSRRMCDLLPFCRYMRLLLGSPSIAFE